MGASTVGVVAVVLDAVRFLPRHMSRGVDRVQLVVECPNTVPLELEVEEPVDVLEEVLEPIRWRWLSRQPVDVSWVMFDYPPELELLVLPESDPIHTHNNHIYIYDIRTL